MILLLIGMLKDDYVVLSGYSHLDGGPTDAFYTSQVDSRRSNVQDGSSCGERQREGNLIKSGDLSSSR